LTLRDFSEQAGAFELLVILLQHGTLAKAEIVNALRRSSTTAYNALKLLKKTELIVEVEAQSFPYRKDVSLTEKGRRAATSLVELERILSEK
jgi:DNA-binding PadR family transcriptional regulator